MTELMGDKYVRRTSREAYDYLTKKNVLGKMQLETYRTLFHMGPLTGQELSWELEKPGMWKRCSELKARGLADEVGERVCRITGRVAIIWDVTDKMPSGRGTPKSTTVDQLRERIRKLQARLEKLERKMGI